MSRSSTGRTAPSAGPAATGATASTAAPPRGPRRGGWAEQHAPPRRREEFEPAAHHHVALAVDDVEKAVLVEVTYVAGVHPPVPQGLGGARGVDVAEHLSQLPGADLADLAHRNRAGMLALDPHLHVGEGAPRDGGPAE